MHRRFFEMNESMDRLSVEREGPAGWPRGWHEHGGGEHAPERGFGGRGRGSLMRVM